MNHYGQLANDYEHLSHRFAKEGAFDSARFYREVAQRCLAYCLEAA